MRNKHTSFENGIKSFVPENAFSEVMRLWEENAFQLTISRPRKTKKGDFKPDIRGVFHRISVNGNLNKFEFLFVLIHEYAHLVVWKKYGRQVKSHGKEWKYEFQVHLLPFLKMNVFPEDVNRAIVQYIQDPKAASSTDMVLQKMFKNYDEKNPNEILVEDIPVGEMFVYNNRLFRMEKKLRKNYVCMEVDSSRKYRFNPLVPVLLFDEIQE